MESTAVVRALTALAQETRLAVFRALVEAGPQGLAAGRIAEMVGCPAATLSFHLKELSYAALLDSRQEGRYVIYSVKFQTMRELMEYLTENCCGGDVAACAAEFCPPAPKSARRKHETLSRARRRR